jgi:valyl-tRNA synthetase
MAEELSKIYEPGKVEADAYQLWLKGSHFHATPPKQGGRDSKPYTIVIPPPNVTGALHMGHALNNTLQDILIRFRRMQGFNALWMPGTDHAGIATQSVVEKKLFAETGKNRHDVGREALVKKIWDWKNEYGNRILDQLRAIGSSCDWDRTRFTLDDMCAAAVRHTFSELFREGLIYRGKRLVNWDPVLQTAVADDEVEHRTVQGTFTYIRYPFESGKGYVTVATTRPETMLGDTAVAVNPKDERAAKLIGQFVILPLMNRRIPIIGDDYVKRGEGTGFLKVTPAHDPNDYEIGLRHGLEMINILTGDAKINENGGRYCGLDRFVARKAVVADLQAHGLIEKIEPREHEVGHSDRSGAIIEPWLSDQWFVKAQPLAIPAIEAVRSGQVRIHPQRYEKTYLDWLGGLRDWCISRQLWWGHRIPVWHKRVVLTQENWKTELLRWGWDSYLEGKWPAGVSAQIIKVSTGVPVDTAEDTLMPVTRHSEAEYDICICTLQDSDGKAFEKYGFKQDPDVLDTWFSSALWPHSTLGWPQKTPEMEFYYPTNTLITSRDIITLWVSRMVMMSLHNTGMIPFHDVFIHGKILDGEGQTMSKSKGNGIDPVEIIASYGADAMRFSLAMMTTESQDMRMPVTKDEQGRNSSEKFDIGRNFCNKLWNASRFAMMNLDGLDPEAFDPKLMTATDKWILSRLDDTVSDVTEFLADFKFSEPLMSIYRFFWNDFCDWYLEWAKPRMKDPIQRPIAQNVLAFVLDQTLRLLHPFVPFITESIFQKLNEICPVRKLKGLVEAAPASAAIIAGWPTGLESFEDPDIEECISLTQTVIRSIREIRNQYNTPPRKELAASARASQTISDVLLANKALILQLASLSDFTCSPDAARPRTAAAAIANEIEVYVHDVIDVAAETDRLEKQKQQILGFIKPIAAKLSNEGFLAKAKPDVVKQSRDKLDELNEQFTTVEKHLAELRKL